MKYYPLYRVLNFIFILIFLTSLVGIRPVQADSFPSPQPSSIGNTIKAAAPTPPPPGDNFQYGYDANTGQLNFVGGSASHPLMASSGELSAQSLESAGQAVLSRFAPDFGVKDPAKDLRLERTQTWESGATLRYQQQFNGVPVMAGEMLVNSDAHGNVLSLNGKVSADLALDSTQPAISGDQAIQAALAGMKTWYNLDPENIRAGQPELWIYDGRIFQPGDQAVPLLVWRMDVQATGGSTPVNELVLVDAYRGDIALHFNQIDTTWQNLGTLPEDDPLATATAIVELTAAPSPTGTATPAPASTGAPLETATAQPTPTGHPTETAIPESTSTVQPTQAATQTPAEIPTLGSTPPSELATLTPVVTPTSPSRANNPGEVNAQSAATWYVANSGSDSNSCSTPTSPCNTINGVIGKASNGDTIKAAIGVYTGTSDVVNIYKSVDLSGGWNAGFITQSGFSTIDGQNVRREIFINSSVVTTISRFIIKNGNPPGTNQKGGAIYAGETGSLTLIESSINHNAAWSGGAIYSDGQQKLTLINTTIGDNSASNAGGGIYLNNTPQLDLINVTIAKNSNKVHHGGGISLLEPLNSSYAISMRNSILALNTSINTSGVATADDCWSSIGGKTNPVAVQSGGYNLFENTQGCVFNSIPGDITGQDPGLETLPVAGYYPLASDSPALDAGNPALPGSNPNACEAADLVGTARPIDGNQDGSAICDIGAYENDPNNPPISVVIKTGTPQIQVIRRDYAAFSVILKDQLGNLLVNFPVTFTAPQDGASGTFAGTANNQTVAMTNSQGVATAPIFTANDQPGQFVVTASITGTSAAAQFHLENYIQIINKFSLVAGNNQYASHSYSFSTRLQTYVEDTYGRPVDGASVTFTAPSSGASGTFKTNHNSEILVTTDNTGMAIAPEFIANSNQGTYTVHAAVEGFSQIIDFTLTNLDMYVSPDGIDPTTSTGAECTDPAFPCKTIQYTVSKAKSGVTIFSREGIYPENNRSVISRKLLLSGGWNSDFTAQTGISFENGQGNDAGFTVNNAGSLDIRNFVLQHGEITNSGTLMIQNSALISNINEAIKNSGNATLINTTISGISPDTPGGYGTGIINTGAITLRNVTIAAINGYGFENNASSARLSLQNSYIESNCTVESGTVTSLGHNVFRSFLACQATNNGQYLANSTDILGNLSQLGVLMNEGYHLLLAGSPAIDVVPIDSAAACPETDQRGVARPIGSQCDAGAIEYIPPGLSVASSIATNTGDPQKKNLRHTYTPFSVIVKDQFGALLTGAQVTFGAPASGPSGTFADSSNRQTVALTNIEGIATSSVLTANDQAGQFVVTASVAGTVEPVQFHLENYQPVPTKLTIIGGNGIYASTLRPFDARQRVHVEDDYGQPLDGVEVTFTAPSTGASGTFPGGILSASVMTGTDGNATSPEFTANAIQGTYVMLASVQGLDQTVGFTLTNKNIYVSPDGINPNTSTGTECTDPAAPCKTILYAINKASSDVTIFLRTGTYSENMITVNLGRLILSGGWSADFSAQAGLSILDDPNTANAVTVPAGKIMHVYNLTILHAGIANDGVLTMQNSAIINNNGLKNNGSATLSNVTIGGDAQTSAPGTGYGIQNDNGSISLQNVTITGIHGTGLYNSSNFGKTPLFTVQNSIIAGNSQNCAFAYGSLTSLGHNIFGSAPACQAANGTQLTLTNTDQVNVDPKLSVLINHSYHALLVGSPAINAIDPGDPTTTCPATDQRGVARPFGGMCDIGAYEYTPPGLAATLLALSVSPQTAGPNMTFLDPFTVQALDAAGAPVQGLSITFTAPPSGPSGTFADSLTHTTRVETNVAGIAIAPQFTPGGENGRYAVTATAGAVSSSDFLLGNRTPALYVDGINGNDGANNTNDCRSSSSPCKTVNNAVQHAQLGDLIEITSGDYILANGALVATVNQMVYLSGGWDGAFSQQNSRTVFRKATGGSNLNGILVSASGSVYLDRIDFDGFYYPIKNDGKHMAVQNSTIQNANYAVQNGLDSTACLTDVSISNSNVGIENQGDLSLQNGVLQNNPIGLRNNSSGGIAIAKLTNVSITGSRTEGLDNEDGTIVFTNGSIVQGVMAIYNLGDIDLTNITISDNINHGPDNTSGMTSGIYNNGGNVRLTNVTLTRNYNIGGAGGYYTTPYAAAIHNPKGSVTIQNTILARNQANFGRDCDGKITSLGHNLIGDADYCAITPGPGDLIGSGENPLNPHMADLADNGGATLTSALLPGSPAIDAGDSSACPATDQRGVSRPEGSACDIGAYEGIGTGTVMPQILVFKPGNSNTYNPGNLICRTPQVSCTNGSDVDADQAYHFVAGVNQFYLDHFHRESLDGAGMAIVATVHNNLHPNNSYWDGYQVVFSDGFSRADDVVAHELAHGLTRYSSNLFYYYQSGAINESMSDLFGEYFDQTNAEGNDSPAAKWLLGEDLTIGAGRSMSDPPAFKNPDKMTSTYYYIGPNDNGGVHTNSGINNKAVYLMVDGGAFNANTVAPLGWDKTGAIYYYAETHLLTSGSDYSDLYNALLQACSVLTGTDGITTADCQQVRNALDAVQMSQSPNSSYNPEAAACPKGETQNPTSLFADDFENGASSMDIYVQYGQSTLGHSFGLRRRWPVCPVRR